MAGIRITYDDKQARASLSGLHNSMAHTAPLMAQISEYLWRTTTDRFKTQTNSEGNAWKTLNPRYKESKPKNQRDRILTLSGMLRSKIVKQYDERSATVGSNLVYAAIQQFGGRTKPHVILPRHKKALAFGGHVVKSVNHPGSNIPARPFLGLSGEDEKEIVEITLDYLKKGMDA